MKPLTLEQKIENLKKTHAAKVAARKPKSKVIKKVIAKVPKRVITKVTAAPAKKINTETRVALILDTSGSMSSLGQKPEEVYNEWLETTAKEAARTKQKTLVSQFTFDVRTRRVELRQPSNKVTKLSGYIANGASTALRDAIKEAVFMTVDPGRDDISYLFIVITDGIENSSKNCTHEECRALVDKLQKTDNYTFAFMVPQGSKPALLALGALEDNITEWETTVKGLERVSVCTVNSLSNYFTDRMTSNSTRNFYQPDLSSLKPAKEMTDITSKCKVLTADKEEVIKPFVEAKTKSTYIIGNSFYQLTKKETVQASKLVMIKDRTSGKIYANNDARDLIGLPVGKEIKVAPGNHGNYDVFVQSTSTNRKLPRGTIVIVLI